MSEPLIRRILERVLELIDGVTAGVLPPLVVALARVEALTTQLLLLLGATLISAIAGLAAYRSRGLAAGLVASLAVHAATLAAPGAELPRAVAAAALATAAAVGIGRLALAPLARRSSDRLRVTLLGALLALLAISAALLAAPYVPWIVVVAVSTAAIANWVAPSGYESTDSSTRHITVILDVGRLFPVAFIIGIAVGLFGAGGLGHRLVLATASGNRVDAFTTVISIGSVLLASSLMTPDRTPSQRVASDQTELVR